MPKDVDAPIIRSEAETISIVTDWIAKTLGGKVTRVERQGRWRPAWFVDVATPDGDKALYIRAPKKTGSDHAAEMIYDYNVHRLLEEGGVKVPHLYGFIPEIATMVMDKVPGRHDLRHAESESDRESVRRQLAREMAKMHRLDTAPFVAAGLHLPADPLETTLAGLLRIEGRAPEVPPAPDPRLAFLLGWVRRNAPPARTAPKVTAYDAGQFMYDGPVLTAMVDFETAMLGDPLQDLAILRRRTTYEPMGDIPSLFRMYEDEMGEKLDLDMLYFHTVVSSASAVVGSTRAVAKFLNNPAEDGDYIQYIDWVANSTKQGYEGLAEYKRYDMPKLAVPTPSATYAHGSLIAARATTGGLDQSDAFQAYRRRTLMDNLAYMERVATYGAQFAADYLDDAAVILGARPHDIAQADRLLEAYVKQAGPKEDERLFKVLAADILRRAFLLAIPGSIYYDGLTKPVQPLA